MARDLAATWELLTAVTRARQQLASARPLIWEKARLPTSEHTQIVKASAAGERWSRTNNGADQVVMQVSVETLLKDGRRLASCLDIVASPQHWTTQPYITLGGQQLIWEGSASQREDPAGLAESVDSAARSLLDATMKVDFTQLDEQ